LDLSQLTLDTQLRKAALDAFNRALCNELENLNPALQGPVFRG